MAKLVLYVKPTCSTCRQAMGLVRDSGVEHEFVPYFEKKFTAAKLKDLWKKTGLPLKALIRTKEDEARKLDLESLTLDQAVEAALKHPKLIQRPLAEKGGK